MAIEVSDMKKPIAFLLALMLPVCAYAESLRERLGAPEQVTDSYLSATGKQAYTFDAPVEVPDAHAVPIYTVKLRCFTAEEARLAAEACFDGPFTGDSDFFLQVREPTARWPMRRMQYRLQFDSEKLTEGMPMPDGSSLHPLSTLMVENDMSQDGQVIEATLEYQGISEMTTLYEQNEYFSLYNAMNVTGLQMTRAPKGLPRGCTVPIESARARADAIVNAFAPDLTRAGEGIRPNRAGTREAYVFYYTDNRYALPYTFTNDLPLTLADFAVYAPAHHAVLMMTDAGVEYLFSASPTEIVCVEENVQLMPFEQILSVAKSMLPLVYAYWEGNDAFYTVNVERVALGYMRVLDRNNPEQTLIVPVWDFFGHVRKDDGTTVPRFDELGASLLTLNAMDGTVIDRTYGY